MQMLTDFDKIHKLQLLIHFLLEWLKVLLTAPLFTFQLSWKSKENISNTYFTLEAFSKFLKKL